MRQRAETITKRVKGGGGSGAGVSGSGWVGGGGDGGGVSTESRRPRRNSVKPLREQEEQQQGPSLQQINQNLGKQIQKVLQNPQIKNAIATSPLTQQLKQIAVDTLLSTVQDALAFNTYDEMKSKFSSNPRFAEAEKEMNANLPEGGTPEQVKQFQDSVVPEMKKTIKQMYIKQLTSLLAQYPEMKKDLSSIAKQIEAL